MKIPSDAVLLAVDMQRAFDDPAWGARNNPDMETNVMALHAAWRAAGRSIIHIRHDSVEAKSRLRPGLPGHAFKQEAQPALGERVIPKSVHSAFIGTELGEVLRGLVAKTLVVHGIQTNYCVASTARMAGNLGFKTYVVGDACATFAQQGITGTNYSAETLHDVALLELQGEFATVITTQQVVDACGHGA